MERFGSASESSAGTIEFQIPKKVFVVAWDGNHTVAHRCAVDVCEMQIRHPDGQVFRVGLRFEPEFWIASIQ